MRICTETREINCCRDCPNCKVDYPARVAIRQYYMCRIERKAIVNLYDVKEVGWPPIPEWCPLPKVVR
jgi:hypothetical protein